MFVSCFWFVCCSVLGFVFVVKLAGFWFDALGFECWFWWWIWVSRVFVCLRILASDYVIAEFGLLMLAWLIGSCGWFGFDLDFWVGLGLRALRFACGFCLGFALLWFGRYSFLWLSGCF